MSRRALAYAPAREAKRAAVWAPPVVRDCGDEPDTANEALPLVGRLRARLAGSICNPDGTYTVGNCPPDALSQEAADEIERLEDELRLCCELKRAYQEQAAHRRKPLDYDVAHAIFEGWYHDDAGGVEFVRRVEAAHDVRA